MNMKTSLLSLFAGTVFLAGGAIASAGEPVTLASAELDAVTAGQFDRIALASISQSIYQSNTADVDVDQYASATTYGSYSPATAYNTSSVSVYQSNHASQSNSGDATARVN
jgi:hypothetical protein